MKQTYITRSRKRDWIEIGLLALLLGLATGTFAQEASLGNTTVFGGAQMTFFGNHDFKTGGAGTQVGIIGTERTSAAGYGKVNYSANSLVVTGANDANHVDGYVGKLGAGLFVYPVGDNGFYGPFAATGDGTTGAYFHTNPTTAITSNLAGGNYPVLPLGAPFNTTVKAADVTTVSTIEYWDIDGAATSKITLTWDAGSAVGTLTGSNLTKLGIVGWDGSKWVSIASTVDPTSVLTGASSPTAGSITTNSAIIPNAYTAYTLASVLGPVSDLTPSLAITPSTTVGNGQTISVRALIREINNKATTGDVIVLLPVSAHYTINPYNASQTTSNGLGVQNANWTYLGIFGTDHAWQLGGTAGATSIPANGTSAFGLTINYSSNGQGGIENMVISIYEGSGGEINVLNNKDSETITFSIN